MVCQHNGILLATKKEHRIDNAARWMNFENMPSEISQTQKPLYLFTEMSRIGKFRETENQLLWPGWKWLRVMMRVIINRYGFSFEGDRIL